MRYERHEKELKKYINLGPRRRIIDVFQQRLIPDIERELAEKENDDKRDNITMRYNRVISLRVV